VGRRRGGGMGRLCWLCRSGGEGCRAVYLGDEMSCVAYLSSESLVEMCRSYLDDGAWRGCRGFGG
jgi:hypothetical protein